MGTTGLRWSFSSLGCPELDLAGVMELALGAGLAELELRTLEGRVDLPELFREKYGSPAELGRAAALGGAHPREGQCEPAIGAAPLHLRASRRG